MKKIFEEQNIKPKLRPAAFLFDEIDSNCDPTLVKKIVDGLRILADFFKIQIFLTTHNPATISFLSLDELYRVEKRLNGDQTIISIRKAQSKKECITGVTENILLINELYKQVFVEGEKNDDVNFYKEFCNHKTQFKDIQVFFNQMGGKQFSQYFVKNQDDTKINNIFGIIDSDVLSLYAFKFYNNSVCTRESKELVDLTENLLSKFDNNLHFTIRYTIENYIYDPIYVYLVLKNSSDRYDIGCCKTIFGRIDFNIGEFQQIVDSFSKYIKKEWILKIIAEIKKTVAENQKIIAEIQKMVDSHNSGKLQKKVDFDKIGKKQKKVDFDKIEKINLDIRPYLKNLINNEDEEKRLKFLFGIYKQWLYSDDSNKVPIDIRLLGSDPNTNIRINYDPFILFHQGKDIRNILQTKFPKVKIFKDNNEMLKMINRFKHLVFSDIDDILNHIYETD